MLAPREDDDPERLWPRPQSWRRAWRDRGLVAAAWTVLLLGGLMQAWHVWRALLK